MAPVIKHTVRVLETKTGWLNKHTGQTYKTAFGAQKAIKKDAKRLSANGRTVITTIEWETTTFFGKYVVSAIIKQGTSYEI